MSLVQLSLGFQSPGKLPLCPATLSNSAPLSSLGRFHVLLGGPSPRKDGFDGLLRQVPSGYPSVCQCLGDACRRGGEFPSLDESAG